MKKIISVLLIITMLAGFATIPTMGAENQPRVIYEQNFENVSTASELGYTVASTEYNAASTYSIQSWEGSNALLIDHSRTTWGCATMVPASALAGVSKYTIEFTMQQDAFASCKQGIFGVRVGKFSESTAEGDWIYLQNGTSIKATHYNASNASTAMGNAMFTKFSIATIRIEVNAEAGVIRVFSNDKLKFTAQGASTAVEGIYWLAGETKVYVDNLKVTEGVSEGSVDNSADWPVRPDADYTGKQAGEVIFQDNYDAATAIKDLYWQPVSTPYFSSGMIEAALDTAVNGTNCVKVSGGTGDWGAFEIVPAKALETYDQYTIHMTLNAESFGQRFSIMYNSATMDNTQNCGLLELRWDDTILRNQGFVGGSSNSYNDDPLVGITEGTSFELAIQVDRVNGITTTYVNGEYFNVGLNICKDKGAIYVVAQECVVCMDNLMVTAGTYEDYAGEPEEDIPNSGNQGNTNTEATTETAAESTPATEQPTEAAGTAKGGCGSVASLGGVALLIALGTACAAVDSKKRSRK